MVVLGGFLLSGWVARQLWLDEQAQWQARARAETKRLTESLHEAIDASYGTLSALAALAELNPDIEESSFLTALNSMESRAANAFGRGVGLFQLRSNRWELRAGSERVPEAHLLDPFDPESGSALIAVLESARTRPNAWTISEPVTHNDATYVRVALALTSAPEIVVVGTVDLERMVGSLLFSGATDGIQARVFIDRVDGSHTPWLRVEDEEPGRLIVPTQIFTAGVTLGIDWIVSPRFGGALRQTAAWTALGAGGALSLLMGLLLWRQLRANEVVSRRVEVATAALQDKQAELRLLLESTAEGIFGLDAQGRVTFANDAAAALLGHADAAAMIGSDGRALTGAGAGPGSELDADPSAQGAPYWNAVRRLETVDSEDEQFVRQDGSRFFAAYVVSPLRRHGAFQGAVVAFSDISERKKAQALLQEERAQLQSMLDAAPIGAAIEVDGLLRFANRHMRELGGLRLGEPVAGMYVHRADRERVLGLVQATPVVRDVAVQVFAAGGEVRDILLTLMHHSFEGRPGLLVWLDDVTQAREAERVMDEARQKAEEATQAKSDFLANMSHEIRTPMNAIIGMSQLALQFPLDDKPRNYIEKVHRASEHLLGIINDILDFSKIEAGKMRVEAIGFELAEVMDHLASLVGLKARESGLELHFDLRGALPMALVGDPLRLGQVLVNLGNNAVKFTEAGDVVVGIEEVSRGEGRTVLHFWVQDSGIGMTAAQCAQLFQSFSQADASITRRYGGTGLGLAISRRLVELMQGRIWVESVPGAGSTFHFHATFGLPGAQRMLHAEELAGVRVLVIDDNRLARELMAGLLTGFGMVAELAADGAEGLRCAVAAHAEGRPHALVLVDWQMPVLDGLGFIAQLRKTLAIATPPVVLVTAYDREEARVAAQRAGQPLDGMLVKPYTPSSLLEQVGLVLGHTGLVERPERRRNGIDPRDHRHLRGARLLLVEDNAMNQELALALLQGAGIEVVVANHGAEALDILSRDAAFDGVLMDCQMPVMDGFTATTRLRENPAWAALPVIAMTANAMAGDRERVLAVGMNDHIAKPLDVAEMFATMARWVTPRHPAPAFASAPVLEPGSGAEQSPVPREAALPLLPGIDSAAGLARTLGNDALYRRLLLRFLQGQAGFAERFVASRRAGDLETARREAHTLKGTAASIGAMAVASAAAALERACDAESEDVDDLLDAVQQALAPVLDGLRSIEAPERAAGADRPDVSHVAALLHRIAVMLKDSDPDAIALGEDLLEACGGGAWETQARVLHGALECYDFDKAQPLVEAFLLGLAQGSPADSTA
ncbi:hypothetical protein RD110_23410 [Rhodoferax koreense]|uniref:Sensory/regulatory protein RpfC n=1 Tax=Rhodoferax koreensis TaxID=1842727 RepID=A0A1P8K198_9BURK|nr:hypothetical protein RD110_23410 [Rhodoferax koreense]